eukprot:2127371-Pyramimonas_sp.AAC.1
MRASDLVARDARRREPLLVKAAVRELHSPKAAAAAMPPHPRRSAQNTTSTLCIVMCAVKYPLNLVAPP